jgi:cytochrome b pre-mRNA-processing protein 3
MFGHFRRADRTTANARALFRAIVARARTPMFHTRFGVPDTLDGRFDLLTLHAFLVMDGLRTKGAEGETLSRALATVIFAGFEEALRDLGVGDIGLGRRIKAMADAFYGRLEAYGAAADEIRMAEALTRNLYRGAPERGREAAALAHYMLEARGRLAAPGSAAALLGGAAEFGPLPELEP